MATYNDLYPANYYIIKESEHAHLELVYIPMVTDRCVLVEYQDEEQSMNWFKKTEPLFELVEQLTEEQAVIFESLFDADSEDDDSEEWMEDDEEDWFDHGMDDDEEDNHRALNN